MKHRWLAQSDDSKLTLVFGGWALGAAPFRGLTGGGSVLLVDDYTGLDDPLPDLAGFDRVDMLAFSFGVASAAHWLASTGFSPDRLVAVSGTLHPACADRGIAPDIVRATADQLSSASFIKFCRRAGLSADIPVLDIEHPTRRHFIADTCNRLPRKHRIVVIHDRVCCIRAMAVKLDICNANATTAIKAERPPGVKVKPEVCHACQCRCAADRSGKIGTAKYMGIDVIVPIAHFTFDAHAQRPHSLAEVITECTTNHEAGVIFIGDYT